MFQSSGRRVRGRLQNVGTFVAFDPNMMQPATYVTASSVAVGLLYLLVLLSITLNPVTFGYIPTSRRFVVSAQGKNRCPDFSYTGPKRVLALRSHLECAKTCASWSECLHYGYQRSNKSCTLYSMTPTNLYPASDCIFMLVSRLLDIDVNEAPTALVG